MIMKNKNKNYFMLAYIVFIFVVAFTRRLLKPDIWSHIITAITVTSWMMVLSDVFRFGAYSMKKIVEINDSPLKIILEGVDRLRKNYQREGRLGEHTTDEEGKPRKLTISDELDIAEESSFALKKIINRYNKTERMLSTVSQLMLFCAFLLFFFVLFYEPLFSFFNSRIDGLTALSFGTILATQYFANQIQEKAEKAGEMLRAIGMAIEHLNQCSEEEAATNAD